MTETEVMVKEIVGTKKIERKTSSDGLDSKLAALEKATKALQTAAESENLAEFAKANEDAKDAQDDYNNYFTKKIIFPKVQRQLFFFYSKQTEPIYKL